MASRYGLGTAPLGSSPDWRIWWGAQDESTAMHTIQAAIDAGVDWIDTAPFYGWGRAEELVGRALRGRRHQVRILTKAGTVPDGRGGDVEDNSPRAIRADLEASLRRLGTDYVDVVQIHDPDPKVPIEETWAAMQRLIREGSVRAAGLSNHSPEEMDRALAVGPVAVVQHQYSLLRREVEHDGVLAWCERHGVPFLAWSPLASGFLTDGFAQRLEELEPGDFRTWRLPWSVEPARSNVAALVGALATIGAPRGLSAREVALAWLTRTDTVWPIVGARTPAEAAALGNPPSLTDAEISAVESAASMFMPSPDAARQD